MGQSQEGSPFYWKGVNNWTMTFLELERGLRLERHVLKEIVELVTVLGLVHIRDPFFSYFLT